MPRSLAGIPEAYKYRPLQQNEIRILHLQPGESSDSVFVEISSETLSQHIKAYNALSWQWGTEEAKESIRIKHADGPRVWTMAVRPNLLAALKRLRRKDKIVRLWVDAICIEQTQEDDDADKTKLKNLEKANQIALMTDIFRLAKEVKVWLGAADKDLEGDEITTAIKYIRKLVNLDDMDHIAGLERSSFNRSTTNDLRALFKLLRRGWFRRRWVVQEIALARKATLYCGEESVSWTDLADAIALLEKVGRDGTINRMFMNQPTGNHAPEDIGHISSLPAYRLVQNTTGMFRGHDEREVKTWRYTLEELVSYLAAFQASRFHDIIYALLGIASDFKPVHPKASGAPFGNGDDERPTLRKAVSKFEWTLVREPFEADYDKSPLFVFKKFLHEAISRSKSLDIICRPWAPTSGLDTKGKPQTIKLPSWIPSLSQKPFQLTRDGKMVRYNPDPLVGPSSFRHKYYNASGLEPMDSHIDLEDEDSERLEVKGFILDYVDQTWNSSAFGAVPAEWLKAANWTDEKELPPSELWRTLVADRNGQNEDTDRWYPLVFQSVAKERRIEYGFDTHRIIQETVNATVSEVFRRVQAVVWNRKLIRTRGSYMHWLKPGTSQHPGPVGLAPNDVQKGDLICIVFGCSVPLILRLIERTPPRTRLPPRQSSFRRAKSETDMASAAEGSAHPGQAGTRDPSNADGVDAAASGDSTVVPMPKGKEPQREHGSDNGAPAKTHVSDDDIVYTLIGECYIDNMMDGQAIAYYKDTKKESQMFQLK